MPRRTGTARVLLELAGLIVLRARSRACSCSSAAGWPAGCRWPSSTTCETRMYTHLQRLSYALLRPPPDRPADVAGDRRPAGGAVLPRLRPDLLHPARASRWSIVLIALLADRTSQLTLIAMAIAPVLVVLAYRYSRISHPILKDVQQKVADVTTAGRGERGRRARGQGVRPGGARDERASARGSERIFRRAIDAARLQATYVPAMSALPSLAIAGVLLVGGHQVIERRPDAGRLLRRQRLPAAAGRAAADRSACGSASTSGRWPPASGSSRCSTRSATSSSGRTPRPLPDGPGHDPLRATSSFGYDDGRPVLHDVDLDDRGRPHGRADRPHRLRQDDADHADPALLRRRPAAACWSTAWTCATPTLDSLRAAIGIVSQDTFLFSTTVAENIAYGAA